MAAPNAHYCAQTIHKLLQKHKWKRATMSHDYFREVVGRKRIEDPFIEELNAQSVKFFSFVVSRTKSSSDYVVARTHSRYFTDDPAAEIDNED